MNECAICGKKIVDTDVIFCTNHSKAYHIVEDAYALWSNAFDGMKNEDYLKRIVALPETGDRAREIAQFLIKNPGRWK